MIRYVARTIVVTVYATLGLYVLTGVGLLGQRALDTNHTLVNKGINALMNSSERYFQAHPIYPPAVNSPRPQSGAIAP